VVYFANVEVGEVYILKTVLTRLKSSDWRRGDKTFGNPATRCRQLRRKISVTPPLKMCAYTTFLTITLRHTLEFQQVSEWASHNLEILSPMGDQCLEPIRIIECQRTGCL